MDQITKRDLESPAGFGDWGPAEAIALDRMLGTIRRQYELAGYTPLHTPLVERPDILFAKAGGEIRQQVYGLRLMNPAADSPTDEKDLALRFDHTVPLARYVAANQGNLLFPFRRYAIGPVVRGERPKDGRYREFIQADIDVIGDDRLSLDHDAEMISIISNVFDELAFGPFTIRINNRKLLKGFLGSIGCDTEDKARLARKAIDDVEKFGTDETLLALAEIGINQEDASHALDLLTKSYSTDDAFTLLRSRDFGPEFAEGVSELEAVIGTVRQLGVPQHRYRIDLSVARGLDYYTSTVYEARLDEHPNLGSIAGGGRFDNLADNFSSKHLPGVGVSIGVTRLLRRLIKLGIVKPKSKTISSVLVASNDFTVEKEVHLNRARLLRSVGIPTEIYLEKRKLGGQLAFAAKRGIKLVVFTDSGGGAPTGHVVIRNVDVGQQVVVHEDKFLETVRGML
ncbi:histidine--tRNA ligase [Candidatus Kaiserbacteria bacterium RIFCSPHIGHO2_01_FULL_54_36]|uniref:Histidine--tRNA ligase n=1 Tax=Candidatus Kaiserbacteria bacterium RIFCSPHIGHO2_01_FULL_54_36 TaxID=1798482 RepID=A0A1F6CKT7_9BACT|nr:MAG: histidine--tRNA ligase [Candidatus Kaiserbacteria bacterium RIFCSPHIGHO2_01_FULL_54_36]OGG75467.1 MAG: histidine--tRNA ligase [Candidatus Kaiserbacteria bacterium RIFCSPLOWO2_01_FULL_54_22]